MFGLTKDSGVLNAEDGDGENAEDNADLLLFSGAFMAIGGSDNLLEKLLNDFSADGDIDDLSDYKEKINQTAGFAQTLADNLKGNGVENPPTTTILPEWAKEEEETSAVPQQPPVVIVPQAPVVVAPPTPTNSVPIATAQSIATDEDNSKAITLTGTDANGDTLSYSVVGQPSNGTLTGTAPNVSYAPNDNFNGTDSFTFKVNDGSVDSPAATVNITVNAVNDAPVATAQSVSTDEDTTKAITLAGTDSDDTALDYSIVTSPSHGTLTGTAPNVSYVPTANYHGSDSFSFKINDGTEDSNTATVAITVNDINDLPIAVISGVPTDDIIEGVAHIALNANTSTDTDTDTDTDSTVNAWQWAIDNNAGIASGLSFNNASSKEPQLNLPTDLSADKTITISLIVTDNDSGESTKVTKDITLKNLPAQPAISSAEAGDKTITLTWASVSDATSYDVCYSTATISDAKNCTTSTEILLENKSSPLEISELTNETEYHLIVVPKNNAGKGTASAEATATPSEPVVEAASTGLLNDTGITKCGTADGTSNSKACPLIAGASGDSTSGSAGGEDVAVLIPEGQDAKSGRDVTENDNNDGHAGFSFTKLDANGKALADQTATDHPCVKDNVTGLIWEVKTSSGLHNKDNRYNWYNTDSSNNGGTDGYADNNGDICYAYDSSDSATFCNTQAYVARVNAENEGEGLCGATDWRLPSREELRSIVSYDRVNPAIDTAYFPNTVSDLYWSPSPYADFAGDAWGVYFNYGNDGADFKHDNYHVRLVRSGQ